MAAPMPQEERDRILALARSGRGRNEIAAEVGRAPSAVTRVCKAAGVTFDTTATEKAVRTRSVRMAEARLKLAEELMINAQLAARHARSPAKMVALGAAPGGGSAWYETEQLLPPARDRKDLLQASSVAANTAMKLVDFDRATASADVATSMVGGLLSALAAVRDNDPAAD